jgi:glycosyltransferase involved in cell wall biosynthesis
VVAVRWFVKAVWPALLKANPGLLFYVVGMRPTRAIKALEGHGVVVTGRVEDVRPYLAHACAAVAPLSIARGVQNKVLEALAIGCPLVASRLCARPLSLVADQDIVLADTASDYLAALHHLLHSKERCDALSKAGRARVLEDFNWETQWAKIAPWYDRGEAR